MVYQDSGELRVLHGKHRLEVAWPAGLGRWVVLGLRSGLWGAGLVWVVELVRGFLGLGLLLGIFCSSFLGCLVWTILGAGDLDA